MTPAAEPRRERSRTLALLVLGVCVWTLSLAAWVGQTPTFRSDVNLVTVDVSVLDRDGQPVPGLTADDFEIKLNGQVQPVRVLAYETVAEVGTPARVVSGAPTRDTTNAPPTHEPRLFVLLLDDLSITPQRGKSMFFGASRFVAALLPSDYVGFTTTSSTVTINPTLDHAAVEAGIRHVAGELIDPRELPPDAPVGLSEAVNYMAGDTSALMNAISRDCFQGRVVFPQDVTNNRCAEEVERKMRAVGVVARQNARRQIDAYVGVINAMRDAPGLKQLVVISDGLGVASRDLLGDLEPVGHAAAAAGVRVSLLMEEPELTSVATGGGPLFTQVRRDDGKALMWNAETVADITGGTFYRVIGTPDAAFGRVAAASAALYHLGVAAPAKAPPRRDYTVSARVKRAGVTVHANRSAVPPAPPVVVPVEDRIHAAINTGQPYYGVPISLATALRRGDATTGQLDLGANVEIAAGVRGPLTVVFGLVDNAGTLRTGRKTVTVTENGRPARLSLSLPVSPGDYHLRFAVSDADGNVGSIQRVLVAQLARLGPLLASDVLTSWNGPDGNAQFLALEEVPAAAVAVRAFLELYPRPAEPPPPHVQVRWSLLDIDGTVVQEQLLGTALAADTLRAAAQFALETLRPGLYTIRATVLSDGSLLGTASTTIRKSGGS